MVLIQASPVNSYSSLKTHMKSCPLGLPNGNQALQNKTTVASKPTPELRPHPSCFPNTVVIDLLGHTSLQFAFTQFMFSVVSNSL